MSWSLVPNESSDAFSAVYNGAREAFFSVLTPGALQVRLCPPGQGCELCDQIRDLQSSREVKAVLDDSDVSEVVLIGAKRFVRITILAGYKLCSCPLGRLGGH